MYLLSLLASLLQALLDDFLPLLRSSLLGLSNISTEQRIRISKTYAIGQLGSANQINQEEDHLEYGNMSAHIAQRRHTQTESQDLFAATVVRTEVTIGSTSYLLSGVHAELIGKVHEGDVLVVRLEGLGHVSSQNSRHHFAAVRQQDFALGHGLVVHGDSQRLLQYNS